MKLFLINTLLLLSFLGHSQNPDDILGEWTYLEMYKEHNVDEQSKKMADKMFKEMKYTFNSDHSFNMNMMTSNASGKWEVENSKLTLTDVKEIATTMDIIELSPKKLILKWRQGAFVLERTGADLSGSSIEETEIKLAEPSVFNLSDYDVKKIDSFDSSPIEITKSLISQKCIFTATPSTKKDQDQFDLENGLLKSSYLDLKEDGKFDLNIMGTKEEGKWSFNKENAAIITKVGSKSKVWNILFLSKSNLVLDQGEMEDCFFKLVSN